MEISLKHITIRKNENEIKQKELEFFSERFLLHDEVLTIAAIVQHKTIHMHMKIASLGTERDFLIPAQLILYLAHVYNCLHF